MTIEFSLPDIGEGLEEAEVIEWHVKVGDTVARDQPFVDILTDKAQTEMPAPSAGTVVSLGAAVGDMVKVGEVLIVIDDGSGDNTSPTVESSAAPTAPVLPTRVTATTTATPDTGVPTGRRPKASPSTRRLAAELGVDLASVSGTGPGGRILATDVQQATDVPGTSQSLTTTPAAAPAQTPAAEAAAAAVAHGHTQVAEPESTLGQMAFGTHPIRGIRRATARAMDLSWSTIPHVTAMDEYDATELLLARARAKEALARHNTNVTPLALLLVAVARGLRRIPMMNATLDLAGDQITIHEQVNLGVAVASDRGLIVPVIRNADQLGVAAMADEVARLSTAARAGSITQDDLTGGTFTVSNYGSNGGYFAAPIVRPGEAGIVGFGAITKRPIVVDDQVEARPVVPVVVSADHRLIDGDVLSAFQAELQTAIARAVTLLIEVG